MSTEAATSSQPPIVVEVVRQHVEQAAFLWAQRDTLSMADPVDAAAIAVADTRLEANLDALRIAGWTAWPLAMAGFEDFSEKGELFVLAWMCIEFGDTQRLAEVVELGRSLADARRGLVGAMAWQRAPRIGPIVREWIRAADPLKRYLAASACLEHGVDPKQILVPLVADGAAPIRAVAAKLAGRLKRADLLPSLEAALVDPDEDVRLWAAWALTELGSGHLSVPALKAAAVSGRPDAPEAMRAAIGAQTQEDVRAWLGELLKSKETAPLVVRASGMLGDRGMLHWLIRQMRDPSLAQAAGIAFLELFPEARAEPGLFSVDSEDLGEPFAAYFDDDPPNLPVADRVKAWAKTRGLLP